MKCQVDYVDAFLKGKFKWAKGMRFFSGKAIIFGDLNYDDACDIFFTIIECILEVLRH